MGGNVAALWRPGGNLHANKGQHAEDGRGKERRFDILWQFQLLGQSWKYFQTSCYVTQITCMFKPLLLKFSYTYGKMKFYLI